MEETKIQTHARSTVPLRASLRVLHALRESGDGGLDLVEIGKMCAMRLATVKRLVRALLGERCIVPSVDGRFKVVNIAIRTEPPPTADIVRRWRPVMRLVSEITGDSSFLVVRNGRNALCVHREYGHYPVQVLTVTPGQSQPLGIGAGGLALLAALPEQEARQLVLQNEDALSGYRGMTVAIMMEHVATTRVRGFAVIDKAATPGLSGVGVASRDAEGHPQAALSVVGPVDRLPADRKRMIAALLKAHVCGD